MRIALIASVILFLYLGTGIFDHDIWSPTEPTVAGIVWNMYEHGELAVPRINEFAYLEKPPLYYWMALGTVEASGVLNPATLRLPSALMGLASLALVYWIGRRRYGESVAYTITLMGACCVQFYMLSHRASTDTASMFFCFLCFALFARTIPVVRLEEEEEEATAARTILLYDVAAALALAISFFAKNFYTFLIVVPPVTVYLLWRHEFGRLFRLGAITAVFLVLLLIPWCIGLYESGGMEYLRMVFFDNTIGRFFTIADHARYSAGQLSDAFIAEKGDSPYFYLWNLFVTPAPWTFIFLLAVVAFARKIWRRRAGATPVDPFDLFLGISLVSIPLLLTLSSSKVSHYLAPILIIDLWLMGDLLSDLFAKRRAWARWELGLAALNLVLVGAIVTLFPIVFAVLGYASWPVALLALPLLGGVAWLLRRLRQQGITGAWACEFGCAVTVAVFLAMIAVTPELDRNKSYAPFFDVIVPRAEGLRLYTTEAGDHRLPMINYFLRSRLEILVNLYDVFTVLEGSEPAAVIIHEQSYNLIREQVAEVPGVFIYPDGEPELLVFLSNQGE